MITLRPFFRAALALASLLTCPVILGCPFSKVESVGHASRKRRMNVHIVPMEAIATR